MRYDIATQSVARGARPAYRQLGNSADRRKVADAQRCVRRSRQIDGVEQIVRPVLAVHETGTRHLQQLFALAVAGARWAGMTKRWQGSHGLGS